MAEVENFQSITSELIDLERLLKSVKREAKLFLEEEGIESQASKKRQKRCNEPPKSSWARSRVPKAASVGPRPTTTNNLETCEVLEAERNLHTRAPAFTIGLKPKASAKQAAQDEIIAAEPNPMTYYVKDDQMSTKQRKGRGAVFGTTPREDTLVVRNSSPARGASEMQPYYDTEMYEIIEYEEVIPTGYSFGKSDRFADSRQKKAIVRYDNDSVTSNNLDLEKVDKVLRPHTPTLIYTRPSEKRPTSPTTTSETVTPSNNVKIDNLAYRARTPVTTFRPETPVSEKVQQVKAMAGTAPGPGYYDVDHEVLKKTRKGSGITVGQTISAPTRADSRNVRSRKDALETAELGPGCYNPETPRHIRGVKYRPAAESKEQNPRLLRKQYYEQKANDARDFHDNQRYADDSVIRARTPTAVFGRRPTSSASAGERATRSSFSLSPDGKEERIRLAKVDQQGSVLTPAQLAYEVKYNAIERRSGTAVSWKAEAQARQSTQELLAKKSQVQSVLADKQEGDPARRRFYGPSLPIAWVPDKPSLAKRIANHNDSDDEGRATSPTAEVMRLLASRRGDGQNPDDPADRDPYTQAFIRSSYAGALHQKPAVIHMQKTVEKEDIGYRKLTQEERDFDFLGPQLQPDWTANDAAKSLLSKRSKPVTVNLDKRTGREKVRIHGKGMVETEDFGSHTIRKDEDKVGPGEYDVLSQFEISKAKVKGGVVQFDKIVAREDIVGPRGEKPISAQQGEQDLQEDEELGIERLDIDYAKAKDALQKKTKNQNIILYAKDRYPEEKKKAADELARLDHLGGSWFEGMYDTIQKTKGKVVDFDRMKGRSMMEAADEEAIDDELHAELGVQREGEGLDLEVKDHAPNKVNPDGKVLEFADPKKHPRFETDRATREKQARNAMQKPLEIHDDILHERRDITLVDMGKMPGRVTAIDAAEEEEAMAAMVHGHIDEDGAIALGAQTAQQIAQGQLAMKKRIKQGVDMSKQRGRNEVVDDGDVYKQRLRDQAEAALVAEDAGEHGKYFAEPEESKTRNVSGLNPRGLIAWDKQSAAADARHQQQQHEREVIQEVAEVGIGQEELDLAPNKDGTSRHRRIKGGVDWQKQRDDNDISSAEIAHKVVKEKMPLDPLLDPVEVVGQKDGTALDLDDVDPGNFKKGGFSSLSNRLNKGNNQGSSKMSNVVGRQDTIQGQTTVQEVMAKEFGQEIVTGVTAERVAGDVVQIDPSDATMIPRGKQSTAMRSNVSRFPEDLTSTKTGKSNAAKGAIQNKGEKNLLGDEVEEYDNTPRAAGRASTERLDLQVKDDGVRTSRLKALPTMSSRSDRLQARPTVNNEALQQLNLPNSASDNNNAVTDELQLDVRDDTLRRGVGAANTGASSLRNSTSRFPIAAGGQDEAKLVKDLVGQSEELKLDPRDASTRNRTANNGAALSRAATGRGSSTKVTAEKEAAANTKNNKPTASSASSLSTSSRSKTPTTAASTRKASSTDLSGARAPDKYSSSKALPNTKTTADAKDSGAKKPAVTGPMTMSPPTAIGAPTPARPPTKEFFSMEEEMKKLGL